MHIHTYIYIYIYIYIYMYMYIYKNLDDNKNEFHNILYVIK